MKAILQQYNGGEPGVREIPPPSLRPGGVLVQNSVSLVSPGTERLMVDLARKSLLGKARQRPDLVGQVVQKVRRDGLLATVETVRRRLDHPVPLGYSTAGHVLEADSGVHDLRPGDRVACAGAGYASHAEVVFVPRMLVAPLPNKVSPEAGAFSTLGSIALQGLRLAHIELGETVAVIGLGLVGQLAAQLARAAGCRVIGMDTAVARCKLAVDLGAMAAHSTAEEFLAACRHLTLGRGVDKILIAAATSSSDPVDLAGEAARDRATVVVVGAVGTDVPRQLYYAKELTLRVSRSYGPGRYDPAYEESGHDYPIGYVRWTENRNMEAFLQQLAAGVVDVQPLISHRFDIDEADQAYALVSGGSSSEPSLGILLSYPAASSSAATTVDSPEESLRPEPATPSGDRVSSQERVAVGAIGAGQFASAVLLPAMRRLSGVELKTVCAATGVTAQHAQVKFGFDRATTREEEVLEDPSIDAVLIATRHNLHSSQVRTALAAGKHVFVEKPLCLDQGELEQIEEAYQEAQTGRESPLVLTVGYNRRFAPMARKLEEFLAPIKEPLVLTYRVNAGYLPADHWVHDPGQGGGRILGEVCHFVDFLVYLTGSQVDSVSVTAMPNVGRYRDDNLTATMRFVDGSVGTIVYAANGPRALPKERVEVFGGGSGAVLDNFRTLELMGQGKRRVLRSRLTQDKGHHRELEAFFEAIRSGSAGPIPPGDLFDISRTTLEIDRLVRT